MQLLRLLLPTVLLPTLATTGTRNTSYPFKDTSLPSAASTTCCRA